MSNAAAVNEERPDIVFERRGSAGLITLNRPQALNAVSREMVLAISGQLEAWQIDADVSRVVVSASGSRAFSAGGDLRALYELGRDGRYEEALDYFREEYRLNTRIKRYAKPYVALIDGIVMGGGVGISVHGSHRAAGNRFAFAMPEAGIGFFPDIGATWFLPRLPGELGTYCALTGERLNSADATSAGIATHRIASERFSTLTEALTLTTCVDASMDGLASAAGEGALASRRDAINRLFQGERVEDILAALEAEAATNGVHAAFAAATAALIRTKSPTSLKIALAQLRRGAKLGFEECMRTEFRIVSRLVRGHDFYEGVRAVIIDKDQAPRWQPATLEEVSGAEVERHFAPLEAELELP